MLRVLDTPCPVTRPHNSLTTPFYDEETAALEYTTAVHASIRNVRPKRRQKIHAPSDFAIHEDVESTRAPDEHPRPRLTQPAKRKILPLAATHDNYASLQTNRISSSWDPTGDIRDVEIKRKPVVARNRRDNVYIPSEDTTQPSMWMGIFSPVKLQTEESSTLSPMSIDLTGIAARMAEKQRRPTARTPLGLNISVQDHANPGHDQPGAPTGKENVPPGFSGTPTPREQDKHALKISTTGKYPSMRSDSCARSPRPKNHGPPPRRPASIVSVHQSPAINSEAQRPMMTSTTSRDNDKYKLVKQTIPPKFPTRFVEKLALPASHYPQKPLLEHIDCPQMYEDDWLTHQESAISQLVNTIFESAENKVGRPKSQHELRTSLLALYTRPDVSLLHNRVQTAVSSGILSLSRLAAINIEGLNSDVGRRKTFLDFWLNSYNHELLQVALEVVVGRQVCLTSSQGFENIKWTPSSRRIALRLFMEAFLLRNEDATVAIGPKAFGSAMAARTLLRSLMVVKALDMVKLRFLHGTKLLFARSSTTKRSIDAVQSILNMLTPAAGDQFRALRSLGYTVSYEQYPRDEIVCRIKNMAVDLRDGILLTRLVEILLYTQPTTGRLNTPTEAKQTMLMPEGESIMVDGLGSSPLVQHLKVPATSRALKLWNVQIALGALKQVDSVRDLLDDINAERIVDGHREISIKLLWLLVGRFGLPGLLDWSDIQQEISRLTSSPWSIRASELSSVPPQERCEELLLSWAKSVALNHQVSATNLTSTTTSGVCFRAILDEYEPHLGVVRRQQALPADLSARLEAIGCSRHFASLFTTTSRSSSNIHLLSRDFILMALAFLASRLLGATKLTRSAITIQRAWRRYWDKILRERMVKRKEIAQACATAAASDREKVGTTPTGIDESAVGGCDVRTGIEDDIWLSLTGT